MSRIRQLRWVAALAAAVFAANPRAKGQEPQPPVNIDFEEVVAAARNAGPHRGPGNNFRDFNEVTRQAEKTEGLFTLYKTGDHLYAEIRPDQFNHPLLTPVTIARGMAQAGMPVGDDDRVLIFRRVGDRIQIVQRNIHYKAPAGTPIEKAVKQNFTDSVLMALPIVALNPMRGGAVLIDLSDVFMTDFAEIGMGSIDRSRSQWTKVKGFPNNMELELEATYTGGYRRMGSGRGGDGSDPRGITLVLHYSIMKAPDMGYRPRIADDRVGHFLSATKDFGINDSDTNFVRFIDRWRLEKSDSALQALATQEADRLVRRGHRSARVSPLRRGGHQRVEQGVREDRLPQRDRRPLARGRARRFRSRRHELLHVPLDHQRGELRDVVPACQPHDRRDDRRRRHL